MIGFSLCVLSSLIMAFATNLIRPAGILSGGFIGIMIDMIAELIGRNIPTSIWLVCLKYPSKLYFVQKNITTICFFFSLLQVGLTSLFLPLIPTSLPLFDDKILNVIFGGFMFGGSIVIALKVMLQVVEPIL